MNASNTTNDDPDQVMVTASEIAKRYSVTPECVLQWARNGLVPCYRLGPKSVRFIPGEVHKAIKEKSQA